ncbi:MAG: hypothetical protein ACKVUT_04355 [Gaiella sp.]
MSAFLDELARTLATPMPRSRAFRILAGAVVAAAVPALRPQRASAHASVPALTTGCEPKQCKPPEPFLCACRGSKPSNCNSVCGVAGSTCCCFMKGGDLISLIACPPGYRCDPPRESCACIRPCGSSCCKPDEECRNGTCAKKVCGPDITSELESTLSRVKSAFAGWSGAKRFVACTNLVTLPGAASSWDIRELGPGGRSGFSKSYQPSCSTCGHSVQVGTDCHYSGSVNYVVYGVMMRLCHDHFTREESGFADWYSSNEMLELIYIHKNKSGTEAANFQASNNWALAGYHSGSVRPTPPGDRKECTPCPNGYSGRGLTVNWLPYKIGPP